MTESQDLKMQEKKELRSKEEQTIQGTYYVPYTDIYETEEALVLVMEIPGVGKDAVEISLEKDELAVSAVIDPSYYENYKPVYTEYSIGHFSRSFALTSKIDRDKIEASIADGILTLRLPKAEESKPRRISIN